MMRSATPPRATQRVATSEHQKIVQGVKEMFLSAGSEPVVVSEDASLDDPMLASLADATTSTPLSSVEASQASTVMDSDRSNSEPDSGCQTGKSESEDDSADDTQSMTMAASMGRSLSAGSSGSSRKSETTSTMQSKVTLDASGLNSDAVGTSSEPAVNATQKPPLDAGDAIFSMQKFAENANSSWLHYPEDIKTLIWCFVCMPGLAALHYIFPSMSLYLFPFSLYFGLAAAVIAHNHNHCVTFTSPFANILFSNYVSIFYGYPTFGWIPTHNLNHHRFVNRVGDATITWRHTNEHHAAVASTYFFVSTYFQSAPIQAYISRAKANRSRDPKYRNIMTQYIVFATAHISLLLLAVWMRDGHWAQGLRTYGMSMFLPSLFSMYSIMFINYIQHVHCDAWHPYNHSRNFVSSTLNFLLFNNGYHTVHHNNAALHWSKLPAAHEKIEQFIDPRLLVPSFWSFCFESYVLSLANSDYGTKQIGRPPYEEIEATPGAPQYEPMFQGKSYFQVIAMCVRFMLGLSTNSGSSKPKA